MKITFEDNSFIEIIESSNNQNYLTIILCGFKEHKQLVMSSVDISRDQAEIIEKFLSEYKKK